MNQMLLVGLVCCFLALTSSVISTAIDYWYYYSQSVGDVTAKVYMGLWELCAGGSAGSQSQSVCTSFKTIEDAAKAAGVDLDDGWLKGCQALMIMSVIALALGLAAAFIYGFVMKDKRMITVLAGLFSIIGGALSLIAAIIYAVKYEDAINDDQTGGSLHAGFGLAIVAALLGKVAGFVLVRANNNTY